VGRVVDVAANDRWALTVATRIASSEMQQDLRETRGLAYSLGIGSSFWEGRASLVASIATRPENLDVVVGELQRYLSRGAFEVDENQIEAAVNGYLGRMRMRRVTRIGQAYRLCADVAQGEGLEHARLEAEGMRAVTRDDVRRVAVEYLSAGPLVTFVAR
jgi:predicted Zn-dependent peptidase